MRELSPNRLPHISPTYSNCRVFQGPALCLLALNVGTDFLLTHTKWLCCDLNCSFAFFCFFFLGGGGWCCFVLCFLENFWNSLISNFLCVRFFTIIYNNGK